MSLFRHLCVIGLLAGQLSAIAAEGFGDTAGQLKSDLAQALTELNDLQKRIAEEKIPLSAKANEMEDQILAKRRELEKAQRAQENKLVELNALKAEVKRRNDEQQYLVSLLNEYSRLFETRVHIAEAQSYQAVIADTKAAVDNVDFTLLQRINKQIELLQTSMKRLEHLSGGHIFDGSALSPAGVMEKGKFALVGPVALFRGERGDIAGLAELQLGSPEPTVIDIGVESSASIRQIVADRAGALPLDPTSGNALKLTAIKETWLEHIMKGGPVMVPILFLGLFSVVTCLVKWLQIQRIRLANPMDLQRILLCLRKHDQHSATAHANHFKGPVGDLLLTAINHAKEKKEYIEEVLYEKMLHTKPRLERLLPFIALAAAAAPLLGLLGTVTGMINTFNLITVYGTGDPKTLASGISEALITTEFGLVVAIPALLIHAFLSRKVKGVLGTMEQLTVGFINGVPEPTLESTETKKKDNTDNTERMDYV